MRDMDEYWEEYKDGCITCRFYYPGHIGSMEEPPEDPECNNDFCGGVCSVNQYFPFKKGCKNREIKK